MRAVTIIDWGRFDAANAILAQKIRHSGLEIDTILAINRGGAVSGVCLSHLLGHSDFMTFTVKMMASDAPNAARGAARISGAEALTVLEGKQVLLVDDAVGSGLTLVHARRVLAAVGVRSLATAATIWNMEDHRTCPADYFGDTTPGWVLFPWEVSALSTGDI